MRFMSRKHLRTPYPANAPKTKDPAASSRGFKLLELMIVVAISSVMTVVAIPIINTSISDMYLGSAATSLASEFSSARYQAISSGCPIQSPSTRRAPGCGGMYHQGDRMSCHRNGIHL